MEEKPSRPNMGGWLSTQVTTRIRGFADSWKLSAKPLLQSAKSLPTGFLYSCRQTPVGKNPVGKQDFADSN